MRLLLILAFSLTCLLWAGAFAAQAGAQARQTVQIGANPLPVKVVVVTMFEHGELTGDRPGEFQFWVERMPLAQSFDFPLGAFELRYRDDGVLGICVAGGIANATASIMALGLDPRFDLRRSYWLIAGIAGGDPQDTTLGSAVWARHVVDGDLLYEIDGREIPAEWPYGMIPLGGERPAQSPADLETGWVMDNLHFALNPQLTQWAYDTTRSLTIADSPALREGRRAYTGFPRAQAAPNVMLGDTLASSTYWHGALMNQWANDWVRLYAGEGAEFVTTNMEDTGTLTALERLAAQGLVDDQRVMVLRTVSNFSIPPPGKAAAWSAIADYAGNGRPALESAYQVGSVVVEALLDGWQAYRDTIPGGQ